MTPKFPWAHPRKESGQSFVEFAMSLVFLLILFAVMFDLGYAFFTIIALRDTVQEAATYGSVCPVKSDNTASNMQLIMTRISASAVAPLDMRDVTEVDIRFTNTSGTVVSKYTKTSGMLVTGTPVSGGSIIISATAQHRIMVPFIGAVIGTYEYPLTVTVADTVIRNRWLSQCDY